MKKFEAVIVEVEGTEVMLVPNANPLQPGGRAKKLTVAYHMSGENRVILATLDRKDVEIDEDVLVEYGYVRPIENNVPTKLKLKVPGRSRYAEIDELQSIFGDRNFGGYPDHLRTPSKDRGIVIVNAGESLPEELLELLENR